MFAAPVAEPLHPARSIHVEESDSGLAPPVEEAAILYASGRTDAAIDTLLCGICETNTIKRDLNGWFMLFDLFQVQGLKQEFERLAMDFALEFERSAPPWRDAGNGAPGGAEEAPTVAISGVLSAARVQIAQAERVLQQEGCCRLNLGGLDKADPPGCRMLLELLQRGRRGGARVELFHAGPLEKSMRLAVAAENSRAEPAFWQMLMEMLQVQGRQADFEEVSVQYAVQFEVSPPPWEGSAPGRKPARPGNGAGADERFRVQGDLVGVNPPQLNELANYAASHAQVVVDLARVSRVDFVSSASLLNTFRSLRQHGKRIIVMGANEMIAALFAVMGISQFVTLLSNRQH